MSIQLNTSEPSRDLRPSLNSLAKAIAAVIAAGLAPGATATMAARSAVPNIIDTALSFNTKKAPTLGFVAWDILRAALASGITRFFLEIELERKLSEAELVTLVSDILRRAEILATEGKYSLTREHLASPLKNSILRDVIKRIPHEIAIFEPKLPAAEIRAAIEESLTQGLLDVRTSRADEFRTVENALSGLFTEGQEKRQSNMRHQAYLIRRFTQEPIFGQEASGITLSDLYVRQRCLWEKEAHVGNDLPKLDGKDDFGPSRLSENRKAARVRTLHLADLHTTIDQWLLHRDPYDSFRVVAGGPGSGKSTFARALAINVIDGGSYDVLFVPLQDLDPAGSFETRVTNLYRNRTELGFDKVACPLNWMGQGDFDGSIPIRPLLLICDGLDEIAAPDSREASDATADFIQSLNSWIMNRNSGGCYAKAIILGRNISAQDAFQKLNIDIEGLVNVAGLLPVSETEEWKRYAEDHRFDYGQVASIDQRATYWTNWVNSNDESLPSIPDGLKSTGEAAEALKELTSEPLLLYLLLWTGFLQDRWKEAAVNRNVVYEEIFTRIFRRDWGASPLERKSIKYEVKGGHVGTKFFSKDEFFSLQEALGLASWTTGGRTVTLNSFNSALEVYMDDEKREDLLAISGSSFKSVAMQSYTRSADGRDAGYEFVHKTMGEYLIARALVYASFTALEQLNDRVSDARCRSAAADLSKIARLGPLTAEIHRFLSDEIRMRISSEESAKETVRVKFIPMMNWVLRNGFPVHTTSSRIQDERFSLLEEAETRCLDVFWSVGQIISSVAFPYNELIDGGRDGWNAGPIDIDWPHSTSFTVLFSKLANRVHVSNTARLATFNFVDIARQGVTEMCYGSVLFEAYPGIVRPMKWLELSMRGALIEDVAFYGANLWSADFSNSVFKQVNFSGAKMEDAIFEGAHLEHVIFDDAYMSGVNFSNSKLEEVKLGAITLEMATFDRARMQDVSFEVSGEREGTRNGSILYGASFIHSDLNEVDFAKSNLEEAEFSNAVLNDVDFSNTNVEVSLLAEATCRDVFVKQSRSKLNASTIAGVRYLSVREIDERNALKEGRQFSELSPAVSRRRRSAKRNTEQRADI